MDELLDMLISQAMVGAGLWVKKHKLESKISPLTVTLELRDVMTEDKRAISNLALMLIMNQGKPNHEIDVLGKSLAYKMGVSAARRNLEKLISTTMP